MPTTPENEKTQELEALKSENLRLRDTLSLVSDLGRRITSSLDLATVLQSVVDAACDLTKARYGILAVFDTSGKITQFFSHGITNDERERIGDPPQGAGVLSLLPGLDQPLRLADLTQHANSVGFPVNHPPMKSFLGIPLRHGNENLGNLYLAEKEGAPVFSGEDESLLTLFADQGSLAIRNAQSYQEAQSERLRLQVLVDTSPVEVMVVDAGTRLIVLVNREAERILGVTHQPK